MDRRQTLLHASAFRTVGDKTESGLSQEKAVLDFLTETGDPEDTVHKSESVTPVFHLLPEHRRTEALLSHFC
jgi:hypothetical protein